MIARRAFVGRLAGAAAAVVAAPIALLHAAPARAADYESAAHRDAAAFLSRYPELRTHPMPNAVDNGARYFQVADAFKADGIGLRFSELPDDLAAVTYRFMGNESITLNQENDELSEMRAVFAGWAQLRLYTESSGGGVIHAAGHPWLSLDERSRRCDAFATAVMTICGDIDDVPA